MSRTPKSTASPKVWKTFRGPLEIDGKIPEFWIQDIPEEMHEMVVEIMTENFYTNEPIRKFSEFVKDKVSVAEGQEIWRRALKQRLSLICFTKTEDDVTEIAGICINCRRAKSDPKYEIKGGKLRNVLAMLQYVLDKNNFYEEFGIEEYLSDNGAFVFPKYNHQGITTELLKCRKPLCKLIGINMSFTVFTSGRSQKVAERAGFKEYTVISYAELAKVDEKFNIPGLQDYTPYIKLMYNSYIGSSL